MITVQEMMTSSPCTLQASGSIGEARTLMTEKQIRHIPVTDDRNHLQGLVTQRDILAVGNAADVDERQLSDIMIHNVNVIHPTDSLRQAALHMQSHKHGCLPVVDNGELVGIITDSDFVSIAINLIEQVELMEEQEDDTDDFLDEDMPESGIL